MLREQDTEDHPCRSGAVRGGGRGAAGFPDTGIGDGGFYAPPFEENALPGEPEDVGVGWGTLTLGEGLAVSLYSAPAVSGGRAEVCFAVHGDNTAWVMLRVTDEKGNTLGETGLLRPGEYVRYVELSSVPKNGRARVRILCYEPGTYYSLGSADASILLTAPQ